MAVTDADKSKKLAKTIRCVVTIMIKNSSRFIYFEKCRSRDLRSQSVKPTLDVKYKTMFQK